MFNMEKRYRNKIILIIITFTDYTLLVQFILSYATYYWTICDSPHYTILDKQNAYILETKQKRQPQTGFVRQIYLLEVKTGRPHPAQ